MVLHGTILKNESPQNKLRPNSKVVPADGHNPLPPWLAALCSCLVCVGGPLGKSPIVNWGLSMAIIPNHVGGSGKHNLILDGLDMRCSLQNHIPYYCPFSDCQWLPPSFRSKVVQPSQTIADHGCRGKFFTLEGAVYYVYI